MITWSWLENGFPLWDGSFWECAQLFMLSNREIKTEGNNFMNKIFETFGTNQKIEKLEHNSFTNQEVAIIVPKFDKSHRLIKEYDQLLYWRQKQNASLLLHHIALRQNNGSVCILQNDDDTNEMNRRFDYVIFLHDFIESEKENILNYGIETCVNFRDTMPKKEGLAFVKSNFDYVLFYGVPNETTVISSKLLEYLYLGIPIIGICKGNEASDIIEQTRTGEVCDFDVDSIKKILLKTLKREIIYNPQNAEIAKFDREYQAQQISQIIKDILEK